MLANIAQLSPAEKTAWYDVIGRFRTQATRFENAYRALQANESFVREQTPAVRSEYKSLVKRGADVYRKVYGIRQALLDVEAALRGAWDKVRGIWQTVANAAGLSENLAGLGLLPLIPIAAVVAAIATIGYFLNDYAKFSAKLEQLKRLRAQGLSAEQAAAVIERLEGPGLFGRFPLVPIALIVAAAFLLPRLLGRD